MNHPDRLHGLGSDTFADRVMALVAEEPRPTPTRALISAIRTGSPREAAAAMSTAWHLGTVRSWSIAPRVRLHAAALVLSVFAVLGTSASLAAAAVFHVIEQANEQGQTQNDQSGTDQQGPAENVENGQLGSDDPGQGQDQPNGVDADGSVQLGSDDPGLDEPGPNESGAPDTDGPTGTDQPGPDEPGADQPEASDQPGVDQPDAPDQPTPANT
jgi:hypothetical protein